jgi:hypothetical protein
MCCTSVARCVHTCWTSIWWKLVAHKYMQINVHRHVHTRRSVDTGTYICVVQVIPGMYRSQRMPVMGP